MTDDDRDGHCSGRCDGDHAAGGGRAAGGFPRRQFLTAAAAMATAAMLPGRVASAQPAAPKPFRIDVHHHLAPPSWLAQWKVPQPAWDGWTPEKSIEDMDRGGVATSILSITTPGVGFGDAGLAARLARDCNDYGARLISDYPGRFGLFAVLPLPDVDASLREIDYALDMLKVDGIGLLTSYGDKWLGDPAFAPVMEELNRRKAVVYTHPTAANCCRNLVPDLPPPMIEYGTDTTRAIARLLFIGAAARYPDIKLIFSHAGGTMPFLVERFLFQARNPDAGRQVPQGVLPALRRFYYDTAQSTEAAPMAALRKVVPVSQIVFGTDFPYRTTAEHVNGLKADGVFNAKEMQAIERENALRLLPRYRV